MSRISRSALRRWHTAGVGSEIDADGSEDLEADLISLTIPAAMEYVRLVRIGAASIGRRRGLSVRAIDDLRLAVDEVFALLLHDSDHHGSVDVTFEIDDHEMLVNAVQRLGSGAVDVSADAVSRFEEVIADLVDRFEADPRAGVVQFSKRL